MDAQGFPLFAGMAGDDLRGGRPLPSNRVIRWSNFFKFPEVTGDPANKGKRLDTLLAAPLFKLPFIPDPGVKSLAARNLLRGKTFGLPSGETVAEFMGIKHPLTDEHLADIRTIGLTETPLWFYILREAETNTNGERLTGVGGRIVAEVFLGILEGDPMSFLSQSADFRPTLPSTVKGDFTMADLLRFARVGPAPS